MDKSRILLIGAGQLGSRHLQALASLERAATSSHADVLGVIARDYIGPAPSARLAYDRDGDGESEAGQAGAGLTDEDKVALIRQKHPDVVWVAGGTDGGSRDPVRDLVETIALGCTLVDGPPRPAIVYAGNADLRSEIVDLIGEEVEVRMDAEKLEVWYAQRKVDQFPRLRGTGKHRIDYRHIITWLVRKPGAFANYRYRDDLFPTSRFRIAYDLLQAQRPAKATREYLAILELAASESESGVDEVLQMLIATETPITADAVADRLSAEDGKRAVTDVAIEAVDLGLYDGLLQNAEEVPCLEN